MSHTNKKPRGCGTRGKKLITLRLIFFNDFENLK